MKTTHLFLLAALSACSSGSPQILTGRVATGFPVPITEVKVLQGTSVVATSPVDSSGSFQLAVAPGSGYAIRLVGPAHTDLVMPRKTGAIARTFSIRAGGAPFELGAIHFVGSSGSTQFSFHSSGSMDDECDDNDHDSTGATCVCDDDEHEDTCEAGDTESESDDSLSRPDDGSGSSSSSGGDDGDDDGDCVPEHDFPEDGCSGTGSGSGSGGSGSGSGSGSGTPV